MKKIISILFCVLMIATAFPAVQSMNNINKNVKPSSVTQGITGNIWNETQKLLASDGNAWDWFGLSVSFSGDTALIGANMTDDKGADSGSAYIFKRTENTWNQYQKLNASDGATGDNFGVSVSISGDTALIGAPMDDDKGADSGSVYVFTYNGNTWNQRAKILAPDGAAQDFFGWSVFLEGNTALIGAYADEDNGPNSGSVYVFNGSGASWDQQAKLNASDGSPNDRFGWRTSLSGDTALIGAPYADSTKGSAYVFKREGVSWTEQAKLNASDGAAEDYFGNSVSLSGDTALIGAYQDDDKGTNSGSAYMFIRTENTWTLQQKLNASDGTEGDYFGYSVSLDGDTALIGAPADNDTRYFIGSAYMFTRTDNTWTEQQKLLASDGTSNDWFGWSVALSLGTAFIGAPCDNASKGSMYVFVKDSKPPTVTITDPIGFYIRDTKKISFPPGFNFAIVIGKVTIKADASDAQSGMDRVEFYVDNNLQTTVNSAPYQWLWSTSTGIFGKHTIYVKAYDLAGNSAVSETVKVWRFF